MPTSGWLRPTSSSLAVARYAHHGEPWIANRQEYTTFPASQGSFETHEKYFDIQYMVSGREQFGVCKRDGLVEKERNEAGDLIFYEEPEFQEAYSWRRAT